MSAVVEVKNLVKKYKEHVAVDDISFSVEEGELFAFLGENGAGKSTTINILCTILEKTSGEATICGYELGKDDDEIRKSIGIVFQNSVLDNKLTVKENLYTRGSYYGLSRAEIADKLKEYDEYFEMSEIWNRRYEKLSGGQRRRVDICRALLNDPKILFLDEPTTGLDPKSRRLVWDYIDSLRKKRKMTIFLTTHYMEETRDADHVVIMDHGKIMCQGTPAELKSKYAPGHFIWYTAKSPKAEQLLTQLEGEKAIDMSAPKYDVDHYDISIHGNITEFLYQHKDVITDYEIIKGSMDDVFLNITGKELE
ncbi:ABC transporter ATP-binding protein [Acetivibrio mesophilus]|uniref:ABC transporter ATP-binding protein n=1 Tax=Acetivibrio mesophilus TaxID=2487273 RepID=A0A4Q0I878_9FIRM|nr:ABC transporter ATP-binding protein [Acetivibrio mesophilus]ODM26352.1 ABC transporter [Clostridium sp. Bc-iso-3]RXE60588.1 ABC transporter ATP-binding protein [Acetivibrio mesophilus]HHV30354.1 ABC transporter ATP-binding protein [Clostridium sp.]